MEDFFSALAETRDETHLLEFCRVNFLHGTPYVFKDRENDYYRFRKAIADKFEISFQEVLIVGSAKLGFSPRKRKLFDLDSDVDVAIVSSKLFERIMTSIADYQMGLRANRPAVNQTELDRYHKFLEYVAIGWIRPDKLPSSFQIFELRQNWFDFFNCISNGKKEVGNYHVSAGVFKTTADLERYIISDLYSLKINIQVGALNVSTD